MITSNCIFLLTTILMIIGVAYILYLDYKDGE
jgi:threonine/homoserine/homoserine lactone efflux protein